MKNLILIFSALLIGCATTSPMKRVAGTYEAKVGEDTKRIILLGNGDTKSYLNGKKISEDKWKITKIYDLPWRDHPTISKIEVHLDGEIRVFDYWEDRGSIVYTARIDSDGKRIRSPFIQPLIYKRISSTGTPWWGWIDYNEVLPEKWGGGELRLWNK